MILVNENLRDLYLAAGLWGEDGETHSLDGLLRKRAEEKSDEVAIADDPTRQNWTGGKTEQLTWQALDQRVSAMAQFFQGLELPESSVIAVYGPNTSDCVVSLLAIHRAGFIAAPLPTFWQKHELSTYLNEIQPRVLIAADKLEDDELALRVRDIAGSIFSVKYVFGFGDALPDGVVNIGELLPTIMEAVDPAQTLPLPHPDFVATIHPADLQSSDSEIALPRSSNQWIAAHSAMMENAITSGPVFSPFSFAGLAGFGAGIVHMLKTGETLQLHHYEDDIKLLSAIDESKPAVSLISSGVEMLQAERYSWPSTQIACFWKNHHGTGKACHLGHDDFDVTCLNEMAALSRSREQGRTSPDTLIIEEEPVNVAILLSQTKGSQNAEPSGGEIFIVGAAVPIDLYPTNNEMRALSRLRNQQKSFGARPHIGCRVDETGTGVMPIGFLTGTLHRANQIVPEAELDALYRRVDGVKDAAHIVNPADGRLHAVLVSEKPEIIEADAFTQLLASYGVCESKIPDHVHFIDAIERDASGQMMRNRLMAMIDELQSGPAAEFKKTG